MAHGYTKHGHPCCGKAKVGDRPPLVARCGGSAICAICALETVQRHKTKKTRTGSTPP